MSCKHERRPCPSLSYLHERCTVQCTRNAQGEQDCILRNDYGYRRGKVDRFMRSHGYTVWEASYVLRRMELLTGVV